MDKKPSEQFNFIGAGIMLAALIALSFIVDVDTLKAWIVDAGVWAPVVFILLKISTVVIAPLSGSPLYPLIGLLFGFWPGLFYVALGDLIAYTLTFYISRIFGQKIVMKMISKKEEGLLAKIVEHIGTGKGFFHACLTCFALPELLSYGAGLSKIRYITFILILWPAATVATGVLVLFGSSLSGSDKSLLISAGLPILGAVAMLVGGSFFVKAIKNKKANSVKIQDMKCPNCDKEMKVVSKDTSSNPTDGKVYDRAVNQCESCDIWVTTEIPQNK